MKKLLSIILLATSLPTLAGSVGGTGGSTEVTQILNNTELLAQTAQQAKMVQIQLQAALQDPSTPWAQTMASLRKLQSVYNLSLIHI